VITGGEYLAARRAAADLLVRSGIPLQAAEPEGIEVVDFGLGNIRVEGLQLLTIFETGRMAGRILVMTPHQTEPEHWHPPFGQDRGKQEVIRAFWGEVRFYLPGEDTMERGFLVEGKEHLYTMRNEIILEPGDTLVIEPGLKHWFQAGEEGAVFYSFSTTVRDASDGFTDPGVVR
jgi:D-lyxose ketol-isomerase